MTCSVSGLFGVALLSTAALIAHSQTSSAKQLVANKAREDQRAHEQQIKDQAQAAQIERQATFKKAVSTCLHGRGYTTG